MNEMNSNNASEIASERASALEQLVARGTESEQILASIKTYELAVDAAPMLAVSFFDPLPRISTTAGSSNGS